MGGESGLSDYTQSYVREQDGDQEAHVHLILFLNGMLKELNLLLKGLLPATV